MAEAERADGLAEECRTFTAYLIACEPADDVVASYQRAHHIGAVASSAASSRALDLALLRLAHSGPAGARLADGYAAVFARNSLLRRKLVLLVAILESRGDTARQLDTADRGSRVGWVLGAVARIGVCGLRLGVAGVMIPPLRLWYRVVRPGQALTPPAA